MRHNVHDVAGVWCFHYEAMAHEHSHESGGRRASRLSRVWAPGHQVTRAEPRLGGRPVSPANDPTLAGHSTGRPSLTEPAGQGTTGLSRTYRRWPSEFHKRIRLRRSAARMLRSLAASGGRSLTDYPLTVRQRERHSDPCSVQRGGLPRLQRRSARRARRRPRHDQTAGGVRGHPGQATPA